MHACCRKDNIDLLLSGAHTVQEPMVGNAWVRHLAGSFTTPLGSYWSSAAFCDLLENVRLSDVPDIVTGTWSQVAMEDGCSTSRPFFLLAFACTGGAGLGIGDFDMVYSLQNFACVHFITAGTSERHC